MQIDYASVDEVLAVTAQIKAKRIRGISPLENEFSELLEHRDSLVSRLCTLELREFVSRLIPAEGNEPDHLNELQRLRPLLEPRALELKGVCIFKKPKKGSTFPLIVVRRGISVSMLTYLASDKEDLEKEVGVILEAPMLRKKFYSWLLESTLGEIISFVQKKAKEELGKEKFETMEDLTDYRSLANSLIQCRTRLLRGEVHQQAA